MIKYKLRCKSTYCSEQNEFDGWFQNIEAFEKQMSLGLINCPICGSHNIIKLLATPNVRKAKSQTTNNNKIDNDRTLEVLEKQALVQAQAGCDVIAPSDMMDGLSLIHI